MNQKSKPGILPSQEIDAAIRSQLISSKTPITGDQIQPASIDLRLDKTAYRVRASFLPGNYATVKDKLKNMMMHKIDISKGAVLEKGCVYIVPIQESLNLTKDISGMANPKSSTGRLDIFTRIITDKAEEFDRIESGYKGPLYAEISPLTFSVLVHQGSRLSQLRLRRGNFGTDDGVSFTVDLKGFKVGYQKTNIVGYKAKKHAGVIDIENIDHYNLIDYWDPITARTDKTLVLDPDEFYILASKEAVSVPPDQAAEMRAYDTLVGEFRVHYAGFFDPGFGHDSAGGVGSRAVLEVRSHDVPFVLEDGQMVGHLVFEPLTHTPNLLYGSGMNSNYQNQGLKLSKHFISV